MLFSFLENAIGIVFPNRTPFQRSDGQFAFDIVMELRSVDKKRDSAAHSFIFDFGNQNSPFADKNYPELKRQVEAISDKFKNLIQEIENSKLNWMLKDNLQNVKAMSDHYANFCSANDYDGLYAWNVVTNFKMMFNGDYSDPEKLECWIDAHVWALVLDKAFFNIAALQVHRGERELIASRERIQSQTKEKQVEEAKRQPGGKKVDVCVTVRKDNSEILVGESKKNIEENSDLAQQDLLKLQVKNSTT